MSWATGRMWVPMDPSSIIRLPLPGFIHWGFWPLRKVVSNSLHSWTNALWCRLKHGEQYTKYCTRFPSWFISFLSDTLEDHWVVPKGERLCSVTGVRSLDRPMCHALTLEILFMSLFGLVRVWFGVGILCFGREGSQSGSAVYRCLWLRTILKSPFSHLSLWEDDLCLRHIACSFTVVFLFVVLLASFFIIK